METTRTRSASHRIALADATCGDVDAGIAATRRIQHLTVVARDNINEPESLDQDALAKAVVKALYTEHPHIRLEDALELARIVDCPPADIPTTHAIQHVIADACAHLDRWNRRETHARAEQE